MKITKIPGLGRFGIYIDDVDFTTMTDDEWMEIGKLHLENLVTIIRSCNMSWETQPDWTEKFGPRRSGIRYYMEKKYGQGWNWLYTEALADNPILSELDRYTIKAISKVQYQTPSGKSFMKVSGARDAEGNALGMFAEGELLWHSNESGTLTWTPGVALLAQKNVVGSATGFVTTVDYYENVSDSFRRELDEMIILHRFTPGKINPGLNKEQDAIMHANMCPEDDRELPMVIQSPGGLIGLHHSINTAYSIKGMSKKESDEVFDRINKELFVDKYMYDHWYQNNNDLMLFDNSITLHRRLGNIEDRMCYRIAHDYTNLQTGPYQPYLHEPFIGEYDREIRHIVKIAGIKNFKLPSRNLMGSIKSFVGKYAHA